MSILKKLCAICAVLVLASSTNVVVAEEVGTLVHADETGELSAPTVTTPLSLGGVLPVGYPMRADVLGEPVGVKGRVAPPEGIHRYFIDALSSFSLGVDALPSHPSQNERGATKRAIQHEHIEHYSLDLTDVFTLWVYASASASHPLYFDSLIEGQKRRILGNTRTGLTEEPALAPALATTTPPVTLPEYKCGDLDSYNIQVMKGNHTPADKTHHQNIKNWHDEVKGAYGERVYQWIGLVENCWPSPHWPLAMCVMYHESKGREREPSSTGGSRTGDYGLFQINKKTWAKVFGFDTEHWLDPVNNVRMARDITVGGKGQAKWGDYGNPHKWIGWGTLHKCKPQWNHMLSSK